MKNIKSLVPFLLIAALIYFGLAWMIAVGNVDSMTCPKGQHVVSNPFTLGATEACKS